MPKVKSQVFAPVSNNNCKHDHLLNVEAENFSSWASGILKSYPYAPSLNNYVNRIRSELNNRPNEDNESDDIRHLDIATELQIHGGCPYPPYLGVYETGKARFYVAFHDVEAMSNERTIRLSPSRHTHDLRTRNQGDLELEFERKTDMDSFHRIVRSVCVEVHSSWKAHAQAFANIDPSLSTGSSEEIMAAACDQEFKWTGRGDSTGCILM
jgi:hypothetical protein